MKTADQILDNVMCCTIEEDAEDVKENYYYRHNDVVKAIEQAQKDAYNKALDDALEEISDYRLEYDDPHDYSLGGSVQFQTGKKSGLKN